VSTCNGGGGRHFELATNTDTLFVISIITIIFLMTLIQLLAVRYLLFSVCVCLLVRERSALSDPYCQSRWMSVSLLVRECSALADPYCHLAWMSVCMYVHNVRNFEVKYLGNQRS